MSTPPPPRPMTVTLDAKSAEILRRCYRGENPPTVLARALRMLATADGHLDPAGRIITARDRTRGQA
ncbi:hypothetical protein [Streptomyces sp. NPDC059994]|uniref:hypothetical protein n=1 Tax=Streptomyces sp. NPDC059994 TaxID=3347029 RepID=UPI0036B4D3E0